MPEDRAAPEDEQGTEGDKRRRDRVLPDLVKRLVETAVERGVERLADTPENLRNFVGELKLPKEVLQHVYAQIDETKNGLYRVVAKELRDVLEHTKFADELAAVLTKLSFEVRMEVRFVPNQAAATAEKGAGSDEGSTLGAAPGTKPGTGAPSDKGAMPRPQISTQVSVKDQSKEGRRPRRHEDP